MTPPTDDSGQGVLGELRAAHPGWPVITAVVQGFSAARRTDHGGLRAIFAPTVDQLAAALAAADG